MIWTHDTGISLDARQDDMYDVTHLDLIFDPLRLDHAGAYECQVASKNKQSRHITLSVIGR